jgi:hypothetical protein
MVDLSDIRGRIKEIRYALILTLIRIKYEAKR